MRRGAAREGRAAVDDIDVALFRTHRQIDAGKCCDRPRERSGRIDHEAAGERRTRGERGSRDAGAPARDRHHLVRDVDGTLRARLALEALQKRVGIEPPLIRKAERAEGDALGAEPGKALPECRRRQKRVVGAMRPLRRVILLEDGPALLAREEEIAALVKAHLRHFAVYREIIADVLDEMDAEFRHLDVARGRELLAHPTRRAGGGGAPVARIALDHREPAAEVRARGEEGGDAAADRPAADDHHVERFRHDAFPPAVARCLLMEWRLSCQGLSADP